MNAYRYFVVCPFQCAFEARGTTFARVCVPVDSNDAVSNFGPGLSNSSGLLSLSRISVFKLALTNGTSCSSQQLGRKVG